MVVIWSHLAYESLDNPPSPAGMNTWFLGCGLKFFEDVVGTAITSLQYLFRALGETMIAVLG
jgi:hypothetical protein